MSGDDTREPSLDATESETLSTRGNSMRENRETPETPSADGAGGRPEKAQGRTSGMHVSGESDNPIVPTKRANKAGVPAAESVEGRGLTKGNTVGSTAYRAPNRGRASIGLEGVRKLAGRSKETRFTTLLHHVNLELLRESYEALNRQASPGIDEMTWKEYGRDLEARLADLHERVHCGTYRAKPSKRAWIPKADGRQRPLGIASLEDKIVQQAVRTVLEQVYEEDFLGLSYGFRPGRSQHDALDALWVGLMQRKVNWVLDADIQGFFDAIDHEWMQKFIEHRIADRRILRLIRKWLRAGVSDDGQWSRTTVGTPQGAVISPLLANIYLHYVLDLWANHWRDTAARGDVIIVRYADDFVMGFEHRSEAEQFLRLLKERMSKFGLRLHPEKTRLIEFGRFAEERRARRGERRPETFDFLGFTHYCSKTRKGRFTIKRQTIGKRMRATLGRIREDLRRRMHVPIKRVGPWLRSVVQGWFNYHAVPGNFPHLEEFRKQVARTWLAMLRRRSQKGRKRWNWDRFNRVANRWLPRARILHPYPNQRLFVTTRGRSRMR
jgi:group II intron reverse transcriptase/maturase